VFPFVEDLLTEDDGMSDWNRGVIDEFRANEGRVASFARQPLLLLTHTGARTGTRRTNPLAYFRDGERYIVVASKGGAPSNPELVLQPAGEPTRNDRSRNRAPRGDRRSGGSRRARSFVGDDHREEPGLQGLREADPKDHPRGDPDARQSDDDRIWGEPPGERAAATLRTALSADGDSRGRSGSRSGSRLHGPPRTPGV